MLHCTILFINKILLFFRLKKDISVVIWAFSQFHIVTAVWFAMNFSIVFILYPSFRFWATTRSEIKKTRLSNYFLIITSKTFNSCQQSIKVLFLFFLYLEYYDLLFCTLFIVYQLGLLLFPAKMVVMYNLPPVSSFTVLAEQVSLYLSEYMLMYKICCIWVWFSEHLFLNVFDLPGHSINKNILIIFCLSVTIL